MIQLCKYWWLPGQVQDVHGSSGLLLNLCEINQCLLQTLLVVRKGKLELTLKTFATPQNNNNESFTDLHSDTYQQFFQLSWLA